MSSQQGRAAQTCRDKKIRQFYSQVSRRSGRPKAKVAAARKLLINCYVMLRDDINYEQFAIGGAKLACARGQESWAETPQSLEERWHGQPFPTKEPEMSQSSFM